MSSSRGVSPNLFWRESLVDESIKPRRYCRRLETGSRPTQYSPSRTARILFIRISVPQSFSTTPRAPSCKASTICSLSAAAVSSCCWDPAFEAHVGPSAARHFRAEGWPGVLESADPFWKQISLLENARRISTPILVNAADQELLSAILSYTGLREAGVPIDLFVYPGEYHARWQPAHRLATYRRSLDWFDYWLRGIRSDAADRQIEIKEWDRLKEEAGHGHAI